MSPVDVTAYYIQAKASGGLEVSGYMADQGSSEEE